jgi:hypothetical protein
MQGGNVSKSYWRLALELVKHSKIDALLTGIDVSGETMK